ncbi:glutamate--cysteine ligase [Arthrobacter antioxidans]|uniref:glutamate--cysteine ligase n=1 Tax=Arthrobacter antioxidans TaxID=2895818 RepID=UPI00200014BB|nr:glutamate--cysteine ligase [Arthrobacter antioxidans]
MTAASPRIFASVAFPRGTALNSSTSRPGGRPVGSGRRTFGVEEEFLLVDPRTGRPAPVAEQSLQFRPYRQGLGAGPILTPEVQQEQLEVVSPVCTTLREVAAAIRNGRALADEAARAVGARAVALATSPVAVTPTPVPQPRFLKMAARFGLTFQEQLTCGFHVHVGVDSGEEGVAVLDRIRIWLPVLLALSVNSPFWQGRDSGYASYRYQAWSRWPTAGPSQLFGSERAYRSHVQSLLAADVLVDEGMVYFDARLSRHHPTIEVRIADVCLEPEHATTIAAIVRALTEQAAREWRAGTPAPRRSDAQLRLAAWQASRSGVEGDLLHPVLNSPCPAPEAVQALLTHVRPVLAGTGDDEQVALGVSRILTAGTGSRTQLETMATSQSLAAVVADAVERTHGTATTTQRRSHRLHNT